MHRLQRVSLAKWALLTATLFWGSKSHRQQWTLDGSCTCVWLTPSSRVLLEKLTGVQLDKRFHAFYGTRKFTTAFTNVRHLFVSWARLIQSMPPHPASRRSILILFSHLRLGLPSGLLPSGFPTKILYTHLLSHTRYMSRPSHSCRFYHSNNYSGSCYEVNYCIIECMYLCIHYWCLTTMCLYRTVCSYLQAVL